MPGWQLPSRSAVAPILYTGHQAEILHGSPASTFAEVVEFGDQYRLTQGIIPEDAQLHSIGPVECLRFYAAIVCRRNDLDKLAICIVVA